MRGPHRIVADCKTDAAAMTAIWPSFAGFAWPWLLLALPLPWLLRRLLPPARSASAALKVPYGARLAAIAGRSEECRVGKECVSTCRSGGSAAHLKKKQQDNMR